MIKWFKKQYKKSIEKSSEKYMVWHEAFIARYIASEAFKKYEESAREAVSVYNASEKDSLDLKILIEALFRSKLKSTSGLIPLIDEYDEFGAFYFGMSESLIEYKMQCAILDMVWPEGKVCSA